MIVSILFGTYAATLSPFFKFNDLRYEENLQTFSYNVFQVMLSSKPLSEISLPKNLYLLVDKNTELEPRLLKDYSEWHFLPEEDLRRYTIEIFQEKKKAQYKCQKNQKLIKVPNPDVFLKASTILKSKGISRIVFENSLLAI